MIIWINKTFFLYSSSVYYCHCFLISSASVRSLLFLSFIVPIFKWIVPVVSLILLKRSLVFSILLFSSISLHWSLMQALKKKIYPCYSLELCIQIGIPFLFSYIFSFFYFSAICKAFSDNHFAFLYFFFLGMVLVTGSYTVLQTSVDSSSSTLSDLILWIYLSLPLSKHKDLI